MTTIQWLSRGRGIEKEIRALEEEKKSALEYRGKIDEERCQKKKDIKEYVQPQEEINEKYMELLDRRIAELVAVKIQIICAVTKIEDATLRAILIARYVNLKTWEEIALDTNYCCKQVRRLHKKALNALEDVLECPVDRVI